MASRGKKKRMLKQQDSDNKSLEEECWDAHLRALNTIFSEDIFEDFEFDFNDELED